MNIHLLPAADSDRLRRFLALPPAGCFPQYSPEWLAVVTQIFGDTEHKLVVESDGEICGYMPFRVRTQGGFTFLNASPVLGSYGSVLLRSGLGAATVADIYRKVFDFLDAFCREQRVDGATVIGNPLQPGEQAVFAEFWRHDYYAAKINLMNVLQEPVKYKYNNYYGIRKAEKAGVRVTTEFNEQNLANFHRVYTANRLKYNAHVFSSEFFRAVHELMVKTNRADFMFAYLGEVFVGGILTLKHHPIVAYHEPVLDDAYRHLQASSFMINLLIEKYKSEGYTYWSWGASPSSECGVFKFKSSWSPRQFPYGCYTKLYTPLAELRARGLSYEQLLRDFRYYFVVDYDLLK